MLDSEGVVFEDAGILSLHWDMASPHRQWAEMQTAGRWTPSVPLLKNKEGLKFNEEETLKEAIAILATGKVQNGAALAQPRRGAGTERCEEIMRCAGCHGLMDRPAIGPSVRAVRVMWKESTACCWTASMASHSS